MAGVVAAEVEARVPGSYELPSTVAHQTTKFAALSASICHSRGMDGEEQGRLPWLVGFTRDDDDDPSSNFQR